MEIYCDIIEDPVFAASALRIESDAKRWDEIMFGVTWTISKNPEESARVKKGSNLRLLFTRAFPGIPSLRILFEIISKDKCILRDVSIVGDAEDADVIGE